MKTNLFKQGAIFIFMLLFVNFMHAQTTISGTVTDAETQDPLPSVNIIIAGTTVGTFTDFDGNFTLETDTELPFSIEVSSVGFSLQTIEVTSANQSLNVQLNVGQNLEEIIVSASRKPQKVQEAPSSVSIISSRDLENSSAVVDPVRNLVNIPGVQLQQHSANSLNLEMRAGSGVFGTSTFPMLDYRYLVTPAAGSFLSYQTGLSNIDIQRVEVVRGAASALYGPGVTSGVVHFISKSAIDYPGTTIEAFVGELETQGYGLRHAWSNDSKTFGYKVNANWKKGNDFTLDAVEDYERMQNYASSIYNPAIGIDGKVDLSKPGSKLLGPEDLDPDGDGNPLIDNYKNYSANAHLEFRPSDKTNYVFSAGFANGGGLFFNNLGPGYTQGNDYWYQARIQSGGLFAQVYYNKNDGGSPSAPTFVYGTGLAQIAGRSNTDMQIQYTFDLGSTEFTIGGDHRNIISDSKGSLYGSNDGNDPYAITGAYLQGTTPMGEKIDLTYAGRFDKFNFMDKGGFAPRVALVYKASPKHTFRVSYNKALSGVSSIQQYIDFPLLTVAGKPGDPTGISAWLSGQASAQEITSASPIEVYGAGGLTIPQATPGLPLGVPYGAILTPTLGGLRAAFATNPALVPLAGFEDALVAFFDGSQPALGLGTPWSGPAGFTGSLFQYELLSAAGGGTPTPFDISTAGTSKSKIQTLNSWEIGYNGIIGEKLKVAVDVYTYARKGFTQYTDVGPTVGVLGTDVPGQLSSQAAAAVLASPALRAVVTGGLTPIVTAGATAQVDAAYALVAAGAGVDVAVVNAGLVAGYPARDLAIAGGIAATLPGLVDASMDGLSQAAAGAFLLGGNGFNDVASVDATGFMPILGVVESNQVPQNDGWLHPAIGYRNYGDATRKHWGADVSFEYFVSSKFSYWGNMSYVSRNEWAVGDDDLPFASALNAPQQKYRAGFDYIQGNEGWRASLSYQYDSSFNSNLSLYGGTVQQKDLFDMNLGYDFGTGLRLDVSGTNIFNKKFRAFPGMPVIGRRMIAKATYSF